MKCPKCNKLINLPKTKMIEIYLSSKDKLINAHCKSCGTKFKTRIFIDVSYFVEGVDCEVDLENEKELK